MAIPQPPIDSDIVIGADLPLLLKQIRATTAALRLAAGINIDSLDGTIKEELDSNAAALTSLSTNLSTNYATRAEDMATYVRAFPVANPTGVAAIDRANLVDKIAECEAAGGGVVLLQLHATASPYLTDVQITVPAGVDLIGVGSAIATNATHPTGIKATAVMDSVLYIDGSGKTLKGFQIDCAGLANHGIMYWIGRRGFVQVHVKDAVQDGHHCIGDTGSNNNLIRFDHAAAVGCGRDGFHFSGPVTANNNGAMLLECEAHSNGRHGALIQGWSWKVLGGHWYGNAGYGLMVGVAGDVSTHWGSVDMPWLEGNVLGGAHIASGMRSSRFVLPARGQTVTADSWGNLVLIVESTSSATQSFFDPFNSRAFAADIIAGSGGSSRVDIGAVSRLGSPENIGLRLKHSRLLQAIDTRTSLVTVLHTVLQFTGTNDFATLTAGTAKAYNLTATGAAVGDPVTVGVNLGGNNISLSAHVNAADSVRVVLFNGTGSDIVLGSRNITALVTKLSAA